MQLKLMHESLEEALDTAIKAMGGYKEVGHRMRPEIAPDAAGRWLRDCLNPNCKENLTNRRLQWLLRESRDAGIHAPMELLCSDAGYERPKVATDEAQAKSLLDVIVHNRDELAASLARLERLVQSNPTVLRSVA